MAVVHSICCIRACTVHAYLNAMVERSSVNKEYMFRIIQDDE